MYGIYMSRNYDQAIYDDDSDDSQTVRGRHYPYACMCRERSSPSCVLVVG